MAEKRLCLGEPGNLYVTIGSTAQRCRDIDRHDVRGERVVTNVLFNARWRIHAVRSSTSIQEPFKRLFW